MGVPSLPFTLLLYFIKNIKYKTELLLKVLFFYLFIKHLKTKQNPSGPLPKFVHSQKKKNLQKLSLGWYLVPYLRCILVPKVCI